MIDHGLVDRLVPACARVFRVSDQALCGSGYLVGPRLVATCHHVVASALDATFLCRFGDARIERQARVLRWDSIRDTALLELTEAMTAVPLSCEPPVNAPNEWYGYGFPAFAEGLGLPLDGRVLRPKTVDKDGRPAVCLEVSAFTAELPASVGGFSGSPVLSGRRLLGQLFRVLGADDGWQKPRLGICFATPASAVAALVAAPGEGDVSSLISDGAVAEEPSAQRDLPVSVSECEDGAEAIDAMRSAGSPAEVDQALRRWTKASLQEVEGHLFAAETLVGMGAPDEALAQLALVPDTDRARQLKALALSVKGEHAAAQALLRRLPASEETAGINGGILKRRWLHEGRKAWLLASYHAYRSQNDIQATPYLAVNVGALALQLGDRETCRGEAERAKALMLTRAQSQRSHWDWATLAEAELLLGDLPAAREHYSLAAAAGSGTPRDIAVMRRQARLDLHALGHGRNTLDDVLPVVGVACIVSAQLPERTPTDPRTVQLRSLVEEVLHKRDVAYGFGSAAPAELLFSDAVLKRSGTLGVFLPKPRDEFISDSLGEPWGEWFRRIPAHWISTVAHPSAADPFAGCDDQALRAAATIARSLDEPPLLLAVSAAGSTASDARVARAIARWRSWPWPLDIPGEVLEISAP